MSTEVELEAVTLNDGVAVELNVSPNVLQHIELNLNTADQLTTDSRFIIEQKVNDHWQELVSSSFSKGVNRLDFLATASLIRWRLAGPFYVKVGTVCVTESVLEQQAVLVDVCDEVKDRYRFGFNGQEKVNEWAGIGNHLAFENRAYDSRTGRWYSLDPLQTKYSFVSPYHFAMNNPIVMNDPDGKEAEVTITRNPNGGGVITLSSTVFIDGYNAAAISSEAQKSFATWKQNSGGKGTYIDANGNKWDVEINMTFKIATKEDVQRITNASNESAGENLFISHSEPGRAYAGKYGNAYREYTSKTVPNPDYPGQTRKIRADQATGNQAHVYAGNTPRTVIHENMHLIGLGDRYSDVVYTKTYTDGRVIRETQAQNVSHEGWEGDIMAGADINGKDMGFSQIHVDNLARAALKVSSEKGSDNFIIGRKVDDANNRDAKAVPQTIPITDLSTNKQVGVKSNPGYQEAQPAGSIKP